LQTKNSKGLTDKGHSISDIRSQEDRDLSSADIFRTGGGEVLQMQTFAHFGQKTLYFSKFMVSPHGQGDQFFAILCGRLL